MILDEWVEVRVNGNTVEHYTGKGYVGKPGSLIKVRVVDLHANSTCKVNAKCESCGVVSTISYSTYNRRKWPDKCALCVPHARKTLDEVREAFQVRGYTLLTTHYKNAHQHLSYVCSKHPEYTQDIVYNSLQQGCGCYYCGREKATEARKLTLARVKEVVSTTPYTFVSCNLEDGERSKVHLYCPVHKHSFNLTYNNLQQGNGCRLCGYDSVRGQNNFMFKGKTLYPSQYLRSYLHDWKLSALVEANFKCELSGLGKKVGDLDVHHTVSSKQLEVRLYRDHFGTEDLPSQYDQSTIDTVLPDFVKAHESIKGAVLLHPIHKLFHSLYGKSDGISLDNYLEFSSDFKKGWIVFAEITTNWKPKRSKQAIGRLNDQTKNS